MADIEALKKIAGIEACQFVKSGMKVGLGTGSTVKHTVIELGRRIAEEGLEIVGVPTSLATEKLAIEVGAPPLWQNLPILIIVFFGGFIVNLIWCTILSLKNNTWREFLGSIKTKEGATASLSSSTFIINLIFCAIAGTTWYLQFFFYSMGTTLMGEYEFSSWSLHMASIIIFSTFWALALREWIGVSRKTYNLNIAGLIVLILSMIVIGWGNTLSTNALVN